ncbi:Transcription factor IIIB 90 kDa subunit [Armadillidium vulgare]|nr:Transcription factor IIIB 90 kDa subunit [Armadillidium vulgare]
MPSKCPNCRCVKIEIEGVSDFSACTSCGTVLSDYIVNETQCFENDSEKVSTEGRYTSSNDAASKTNTFVSTSYDLRGWGTKEITLNKANTAINDLCQQLRLGPYYIGISYNIFKLALSKGLTKRTEREFSIGACVYITCRTENTSHMLIDVSDALQVSVFKMGRTYIKFTSALYITTPLIDPCLYVLRFSHELNFGDKTFEVANTALRLIQRMKRDWINTGRKPSGLCGAALLIAARNHNFNRTIHDVVKIVRVHHLTLRKRLKEFGQTPSSDLTPEQFLTMDFEEEEDPPSFKAAREKERVQLLFKQQKNLDLELIDTQRQIEEHLEDRRKKLRNIWTKYDKEEKSHSPKEENVITEKFIAEATLETIYECLAQDKGKEVQQHISSGIGPSTATLGLKSSINECMEIQPSNPQTNETELLDLTSIDDSEIDSYILSDREVKLKTKLWMKVNEEYLEERKLKEEKENIKKEQRLKEGKPAKQKKKYESKRKKKNEEYNGSAKSAGEAIEKMLQTKKLSKKINYGVLMNLDGEKECEKVEKEPEINSSTKGKQLPI